jgi:hypothetical protein
VKLQNSSSDFSVYTTNGEQLAGDLAGYQELAHEIDKKRIVLYIDVSGQVVLCGTRLMVRIIGGREERAIFIRKYPLLEFSLKKDRVRSFYTEAKSRVESMARIRYEILGLLKEGDLLVPERDAALSTMDAITGKILAGEPVKIKIEDLPLSFGVATKILASFTQKDLLNYTIAISQYPVDTDILISPNAAGMDLEILHDGREWVQPSFEKILPLFRAISAVYEERRTALHTGPLQNRNTLSLTLRKYLLDSPIVSDLLAKDPHGAEVLFDMYRNDAGALHAIVKKILALQKNLDGVPAGIIDLVISHILESVRDPGTDERELLKTGYPWGDDDRKKKIQQYLIAQGIFEDYLLKNLAEASLKEGDIQQLKAVVTNQKFNNKGLQVLKDTICLTDATQDQVLKFIEQIFASNLDTDPKGKGHKLYQAIIDHYQQQHFATRKLNQLQERYQRTLNPAARQADKKTLVIAILFAIAAAGLILSVLAHAGLLAFLTAGNQTTGNQTPHQTQVPRTASNPPVLSITILNGSYFEVNGNPAAGQELDEVIAKSNATSVRFFYNATSEIVPKSSISGNVTLDDIIARIANTT